MNETNLEAQYEPAPHTSFPWPTSANTSALDAFIATWKLACFHPTVFFRNMPREGNYGAVILYYLIIGVAGAGIDLFWESVLGEFSIRRNLPFFADAPTRTSSVVDFLLSPVFLLIGLYLVTGVCHLMLLVMRGARHGFETSSRVFAYSYSPMIVAVAPIIGNLIGLVWSIALAIIGLREAHQIDGSKAAVAVLVPLFVLIGVMILAVIAAVMMGLLNTPV